MNNIMGERIDAGRVLSNYTQPKEEEEIAYIYASSVLQLPIS